MIVRQFIPVIFAVFINLLDSCTFGTCFFPAQLGRTSGLAIELFLLSTAIVQIVFICCSAFQSGLGTSMAENIPFIHTMALGIMNSMEVKYSNEEILSTVLVAVSLSTVLNGILFYLLGYWRLGHVLHFFPRHVILGMTGGFGIFLFQTAFEATTGIIVSELTIDSLIIDLTSRRILQMTLVALFESLLRLVEYSKLGGEVAVPLLMFALPLVFYFSLFASHTSFDESREIGWLFPEAPATHWWQTWSSFHLSQVNWLALGEQAPTILSLAFFTLLLVPIRIPSLALVTGEEVDFDTELKAQGLGNILSGLVGCPHNYLSYSNSIFYYNIGGTGKYSQLAVTLTTLSLFVIGPTILNFVPRMLAGVIMCHLGVDLVYAAVVSSREKLDMLEYTSVIGVAAVVSVFGFVPGIAAGGAAACLTFVVQSSQVSNIRGVFTGDAVRSNTNWPMKYREKLEAGLASKRIMVIQLQGHLFFGNIQQVIIGIMKILEDETENHPDFKGLVPRSRRKGNTSENESATASATNSLSTYPNSPKMPVFSDIVGNASRRPHRRVVSQPPRSHSFDKLPLLERGGHGQGQGQGKGKTDSEKALGNADNDQQRAGAGTGGGAGIRSWSHRGLQFLILDCSFVTGIDGNAIAALLKLKKQLHHSNEVEIVFAGLQPHMKHMFGAHEGGGGDRDREHSHHEPRASEGVHERTPLKRPRRSDSFNSLSNGDALSLCVSGRDGGGGGGAGGGRRETGNVTSPTDDSDVTKEAAVAAPYHSDVNIALQYVEEKIIDSIRTPNKAVMQDRMNKRTLHRMTTEAFDENFSAKDASVSAQNYHQLNHSSTNNNATHHNRHHPSSSSSSNSKYVSTQSNDYSTARRGNKKGIAETREEPLFVQERGKGYRTGSSMSPPPAASTTDDVSIFLRESAPLSQSQSRTTSLPIRIVNEPQERSDLVGKGSQNTLNSLWSLSSARPPLPHLDSIGSLEQIQDTRDSRLDSLFENFSETSSYNRSNSSAPGMNQIYGDSELGWGPRWVLGLGSLDSRSSIDTATSARGGGGGGSSYEPHRKHTFLNFDYQRALLRPFQDLSLTPPKYCQLEDLMSDRDRDRVGDDQGTIDIATANDHRSNNDVLDLVYGNEMTVTGYEMREEKEGRGLTLTLVKSSFIDKTIEAEADPSGCSSSSSSTIGNAMARPKSFDNSRHMSSITSTPLAAETTVVPVSLPLESTPPTSQQQQPPYGARLPRVVSIHNRNESDDMSDVLSSVLDLSDLHLLEPYLSDDTSTSNSIRMTLKGRPDGKGIGVRIGDKGQGGEPFRVSSEGSSHQRLQSMPQAKPKPSKPVPSSSTTFPPSSALQHTTSIAPILPEPTSSNNSTNRRNRPNVTPASADSQSHSQLVPYTSPNVSVSVSAIDPPAAAATDPVQHAIYRVNKKLVREKLLDLGKRWNKADEPVLKRLSEYLLNGITEVRQGQLVWSAGDTAKQMGMLLKGRLKALLTRDRYGSQLNVLQSSERVLQTIVPGCLIGELGLLSRGHHSRTIVADEDSLVAIITIQEIDYIEENDKEMMCLLQSLALETAASRSHELMLFNAGSLGP